MVVKMTSSAIITQKIKSQSTVIVVLACSVATLAMINKGFGAKKEASSWLLQKRQTAISCEAYKESAKENQLPDKKNNGCPHMGTSCTLLNTGKRNKTYNLLKGGKQIKKP